MNRPKRKSPRVQHDPEFRIKVVKTSLEKKLDVAEAKDLYGIGAATWYTWKKVYAQEGEEGLRRYGHRPRTGKKKLPPEIQETVRQQAIAVKRKYPFYGVQRVWQWLLRTLFLPVSFRQVRQTLAEADLIQKTVKKKRRPRQPRRFERAKPNELWATDITEFPLAGGQTVWVIAFMDDYSRFIVSWGVYASCATELVLEVLRRGLSVYGRPEEILTDHGPQFWVRRGKTQFQKFLQREDITHIRASTPEANGKIEAFWKTLKDEFVERTQRKGDLEELRDRMGHWVAFYNFQRLHTEVGGAPAERYFQFQQRLREEIQKRIRKNARDLALAKTPPSQILGKSSLGEQVIEIQKEGDKFLVRMGDMVLNETPKETGHETQEAAAGRDAGGGPGGEGEGVGGAGGPGGGEDDRGGLPPGGDQADPLLQARGADGPGDAGGGQAQAGPGSPQGPAGGSQQPGDPDGAVAPGASPDAEPPAGEQEAARGAAEVPQNGVREAENGPSVAEPGSGTPPAGPAAADGDAESVGREE